jgi:hypothetical protein
MCIGSNFAMQGMMKRLPFSFLTFKIPPSFPGLGMGSKRLLTIGTEMKRVTALIYSNFTTHIVDDAGMSEPLDSYSARPSSARLYLRFEWAR